MLQLILGAVVGGLAVWYWGEDLRRYGSTRSDEMRTRAADAMQTVQDRADQVIDSTKERVGTALQAGQEAIRPRNS